MSNTNTREATPGPSTARPIRPPVVQPQASRSTGGASTSIVVNANQRGNTVLDYIKNVQWEWGQIIPDYQVGTTTCVLFLSLRYHRLHPEYIHTRIQKLGNMFVLRILLLMCDVSEHEEPIRELTKICLINNMTIMVAWTPEQAGQYLVTYKLFEHKPPDKIKERVDKDYTSILRSALTSIRGVNKTDVTTLSTNIGSVAEMSEASVEKLLELPGFGEVKSRRVVEAFQKPFRANPFADKARTPFSASQALSSSTTATNGASSSKAGSRPPTMSNANRGPVRPPSPAWDIELDLNESDIETLDETERQAVLDEPPRKKSRPNPAEGSSASNSAPSSSKPSTITRPPRPPSPIWDLELDLNEDDIEAFDETERQAGLTQKSRGVDEGKEEGGGRNGRPARESPEWDIELDLN